MFQDVTKGEAFVRHNSSVLLTGLSIYALSSEADILLLFKNTLIISVSSLLNKPVLHKATSLNDTNTEIRNSDLRQTHGHGI